jgi:hypothetical protein
MARLLERIQRIEMKQRIEISREFCSILMFVNKRDFPRNEKKFVDLKKIYIFLNNNSKKIYLKKYFFYKLYFF